jgi:hypothetical protein
VEDCLFEYFNNNVALISEDATDRIHDVTFYRCVMRYSYTAGGKQGWAQQGLFANKLRDVTIRQCIFYHNGWSKHAGPGRSIFGHNLYLNGSEQVTIENCLIGFGSLRGINLRTANEKDGAVQRDITVRGNVLIGNATGITAGVKQNRTTRGQRLRIEKNLITRHGGIMPVNGESALLANGIVISNWEDGVIRDNLVMHSPQGVGGGAFKVETYKRAHCQDVAFIDNLIYAFGENQVMWHKPGVRLQGNRILADESNNPPTRSLERYIERYTNLTSPEAFMRRASTMRLGHWPLTYTADPILTYVRSGLESQARPSPAASTQPSNR